MKKKVRMTVGIILLTMALAGCNGSSGPGGVTVATVTRKASSTPRDTNTPTQTYTPSETPLPTQVPDLEIFNDRLIDRRDTVGGVYILGRIRNNTNTTMLLPAREYAFAFHFEDYRTFGDGFSLHDTLGPLGLKPGVYGQGGPKSNCILYYHEEGLIFFQRSFLDKLD